ncbi:MAG: hypothetical protein IK016_10740 [Lachnospiraceae bacterium]|nr:hypothetical protein [Lachnospiraceae bacterium]
MRKRQTDRQSLKLIVALLLSVALFATGCGGGNEATTDGQTKAVAPAVETEKEAGPRVMLSRQGKSLTGDMQQLLQGDYSVISLSRSGDTEAEDDEAAAFFNFSLEKAAGEDGYLKVTGSLKMVKDASFFFDLPVEEEDTEEDEEAEEEEALEEEGEAPAEKEEVPAGEEEIPAEEGEEAPEEEELPEDEEIPEEEFPDYQILGADEAAALLTDTINNMLSDTESGAALQTEATGTLGWQYGAAKAFEGQNGSSVLNFCAVAEAEGALLYLKAGAYVKGAADAKQELEQVQEGLTEWMKSLAFADVQGEVVGGNDLLRMPFAGKTLEAPGTDYLRASGADLSVTASAHYLDASYEGMVLTEGKEASFLATLRNKNAVPEEELAALEAVQGDSLNGKGLTWTLSVSEEDGARLLLAKAEAEGQPLFFTMQVTGYGENAAESCDNIIANAKGWLAALSIQ